MNERKKKKKKEKKKERKKEKQEKNEKKRKRNKNKTKRMNMVIWCIEWVTRYIQQMRYAVMKTGMENRRIRGSRREVRWRM